MQHCIYIDVCQGILIHSNYLEAINAFSGVYSTNNKSVSVVGNYVYCSQPSINRGFYLWNTNDVFLINNKTKGISEFTVYAHGKSNNIVLGPNYFDPTDSAILGSFHGMLGPMFCRVQTMSGSNAYRPSNPRTGEMFFDTTLGQPIWYNGTNWVNASGIVV